MRLMARPNIVLTGFMGTGKTTVGRLLAQRLGYAFVDTDELIVARAGRPVAEIFREEGQAAFRRWEAWVAQELAGSEATVIATGGRLMLDEDNAAALSRNARVVCLTAAPEEILARLAGDERRPLLDVADPAGRVRELLQARAAAYGRFHQVSTSGRTPAEVVEKVMQMASSEQLTVDPSKTQDEQLTVDSGQWVLRGLRTDSGQTRLRVSYPGGQYEVVVGWGLLSGLREVAGITGPVAVVTDENVGPLYAGQIGAVDSVVTIPAGERYKTPATVQMIYDELLAAGLDRTATIVALGGGVVGDVAGFVAATYMRGLNFVQCPTTLLAMVDASVGGKTGVDLPQGKNLVGAFKQPAAVIADLATLETLPPAEFAAGMAEVVKHGLIAAPAILERWEMGDGRWEIGIIPKLQSLVVEAIAVKRDIVEGDPFEQGRRAVLNLGHTFGHAIEQVSGYGVRHGEAVAMGLVAAANLSARLGHCAPALQQRIELVLQRLNLPTRIPGGLAPAAILAAMASDKKKAAGKLRFVLIRDVGDVFVTGEVEEAAVLATLAELSNQV